MITKYFKRYYEEIRIEKSERWGTCNYYFEADLNGEVIRQIEVYENNKVLKYSEQMMEDEFGFLTDQPIDLIDFKEFEINKNDFEYQWHR
ncbi:hypothetical protein SAMN05421827_11840 [Pedobacter terrae]|uniref:Uncharacterized protein n=1 Tax=Pedobacter terrae TaxID=405671 RepID=A0A1G8A8K4_9SPHI|nr:hypothetical protein [Pedobacter terrae]SDH17203.1 hypothetical protein SAMN05421827_11840 [Pedobacter terrae]